MRRKRNSKKTLFLVIILLCLSLSIGYAYLSRNLHLNTSVTITKPQVEVFSLFDELKNNAIDDTSINFGAISSDTNGKGIYHLTKIATSTPIYYYRGEVDNNVIFGGFCWKIIRTTDTRGVKLIYNGEPNNGICNATGDATEIGKSVFNEKENDTKYVGYMYDNNTKDSTIKGVIDTWFENNLITCQDYLEDTPFYNERDSVESNEILYASGLRIWGDRTNNAEIVPNTTIKLGATNKEDIFTVSSELGNGKLTYPVGLLTSDEAVMAGGRGYISSSDKGENTKFYLNFGSWYWLLSPTSFNGTYTYGSNIGLAGTGTIGHPNSNIIGGIHPVVSLKPGTNYLSGNGTKESPFVINE